MLLLITVLLVALAFEYINGFHDTANSIAMGVSTKALTPRLAIIIAATTNLAGALVGTAVAKTITKGDDDAVEPRGDRPRDEILRQFGHQSTLQQLQAPPMNRQ